MVGFTYACEAGSLEPQPLTRICGIGVGVANFAISLLSSLDNRPRLPTACFPENGTLSQNHAQILVLIHDPKGPRTHIVYALTPKYLNRACFKVKVHTIRAHGPLYPKP